MAKLITFFAFIWLGLGIIGGVMQGEGGVVATELTANIGAATDILPVTSTTNFPVTAGTDRSIVIGDERITYTAVTATEFGTALNPVVRGATVEGISTTAVPHASGATVYTRQASRVNQAMDYVVATISDASGVWGAISVTVAMLRLVGQFLVAPVSFLGTDLAIITYIWAVMGIGAIVSIGLAMSGARRV